MSVSMLGVSVCPHRNFFFISHWPVLSGFVKVSLFVLIQSVPARLMSPVGGVVWCFFVHSGLYFKKSFYSIALPWDPTSQSLLSSAPCWLLMAWQRQIIDISNPSFNSFFICSVAWESVCFLLPRFSWYVTDKQMTQKLHLSYKTYILDRNVWLECIFRIQIKGTDQYPHILYYTTAVWSLLFSITYKNHVVVALQSIFLFCYLALVICSKNTVCIIMDVYLEHMAHWYNL